MDTMVKSILIVGLLAVGAAARAQEDEIEVRFYDVAGIVREVPDAPATVAPRGDLGVRSPEEPGGSPDGSVISFASFPVMHEEALPNPLVDVDKIFDIVRRAVAAAAPEREDLIERIRFDRGALAVAGTPPVHETVARVLAYLRALARRQVVVECLVVKTDVLDRLAPGWREPPVSADIVGQAFEKALLDDFSAYHMMTARAGQHTASGAEDQQQLLVDHEINQTGVIPVSNPVTPVIPGGTRIEVRPLFAPDGRTVLLELAFGRFDVSAEKHVLGKEWSDLELPRTRETLFSAVLALEPERVVVAGSVGVAALLVRLSAAPATPEPSRLDRAQVFAVYDVTTITRRAHGGWPALNFRHLDELDELDEVVVDPQSLVERVAAAAGHAIRVDQDVIEFHRGCLHAAASVDAVGAIARETIAEFRRRTRSASVDLTVIDAPASVVAAIRGRLEADGVLAPEWRSALGGDDDARQGRLTVSGVAGNVHAARWADVRTVVTDSEGVSGGTGFSINERWDPTTQTCGEGIDVRLRIDLAGEGDRAMLRLDGEAAEILALRPVTARSVSTSGTEGQGTSEVVKEIALTLPHQQVTRWHLARELPLARDVLLEAAALGGGRTRLLIGRVSELK